MMQARSSGPVASRRSASLLAILQKKASYKELVVSKRVLSKRHKGALASFFLCLFTFLRHFLPTRCFFLIFTYTDLHFSIYAYKLILYFSALVYIKTFAFCEYRLPIRQRLSFIVRIFLPSSSFLIHMRHARYISFLLGLFNIFSICYIYTKFLQKVYM